MIGKGERSQEVIEAIVRNGAVYLCAIGGAGALAAQCVKSLEVIGYDDLGCESVKRWRLKTFLLLLLLTVKAITYFSEIHLRCKCDESIGPIIY